MTSLESSILYMCVKSGFYSATVGDSLILRYFYEGVGVMFYWYKQTLVSKFYKHERNGTFRNEFKNDPRLTLDTGNGKNHLTISDLRISESASYYCTGSYANLLEFVDGVSVSVRGSGYIIPALVHQ